MDLRNLKKELNIKKEIDISEDEERFASDLDKFIQGGSLRRAGKAGLKQQGVEFVDRPQPRGRAEREGARSNPGRNRPFMRLPVNMPQSMKDKVPQKYRHMARGEFVDAPAFDKDSIEDFNRDVRQTYGVNESKPSQKIETQVSRRPRAARKNATRPWGELVTAAYLANPNINSIDDVLDTNIPKENINDYLGFVHNLTNATPAEVRKINNYIQNIKNLGSQYNFDVDPKQIFISNVNKSLLPDELKDLLGQNDTSDVFFRDHDGRYKGIDVKNQPEAYHGAGSAGGVRAFLNQVVPQNEYGEASQEILLQYLRELGIPTSPIEFRRMTGLQYGQIDGQKFGLPQELADEYANKFINGAPGEKQDNPYWNFLEDVFKKHPEEAMEVIVNSQFPDDTRYPQFFFDGAEFIPKSRSEVIGDNFEMKRIYNPRPDEGDDSAKDFYALLRNGNPIKKYEARRNGKEPWRAHKFQPQRWEDRFASRQFNRRPSNDDVNLFAAKD